MPENPPPASGRPVRLVMTVGPLEVNCYLLAREPSGGGFAGPVAAPDPDARNATASAAGAPRPCVVIDPGGDGDAIARRLAARGWTPELILLTHAHFDHIGGVEDLRRRYPGVRLAASAETSRRLADPRTNLSVLGGAPIRVEPADTILENGKAFRAAGLDFEPVEIPGHEPGELVYGVREAGWLFTGDVLFAGSVGRTDFPGGDHVALIQGARALLAAWPPSTLILPGHGPESTAGRERAGNPFLSE